jgi:Pertactin
LLTIKNASANNACAATTLPVVVTTNGGTTTTAAFKLASPVTAGGFQYTLTENPSDDDWFLTGSPLPTTQNAITAASIQNSINGLAQAPFNNMVTTRLLGSLLLGANEQVSGCDCGGGSAGVGSFSLGSHGRWALTDNQTLLAGTSWNSFYQDGTNVSASPIVAASLCYDPSNWGTSRPFVEFGAFLSPYTTASYTDEGWLRRLDTRPAETIRPAMRRLFVEEIVPSRQHSAAELPDRGLCKRTLVARRAAADRAGFAG